MFDNVCKFLAETFSTDFAAWLIGQPRTLTELSPAELSLEPIRADALILLQAEDMVLHLEFQTQPDASIPFRMIDYRLRVYRRFPQKAMHQFVIYLSATESDLVQQTAFVLPRTRHEFEVIRLWEQNPESFLQTPGLLPFAALCQTDDSSAVLRQAAQRIQEIQDPRVKSNLAASTAILAGLVLKKDLIRRILRSELMRESVIYQEIREEGLEEGRAEGRAEAMREVALKLIQQNLPLEQIALVTELPLETLRQLADESTPLS
ncbi:Rpn family recombination-promoting nuclease/putative transposase [Leptolyngbya sp. NK1-12]|uniref:Rpn family recombination-promoting nuclease/putative transposase n=1 Tax=Leptolyngbya sp. NK1-12 TaxID=2547451 RepID=A0AA96WCE5_9CYAN|nr:Rpn family recombination-promoting nuclease/putative transposase [Leptolyngbya sp. NK1-12]WNZ23737.1 Rpn family recombination-promoting nuclease/putative transposase [Leptolyngbya sp. NK1-12]